MPRRAKIVLAVAVLIAGLLVAWQFRKSPAEKLTAQTPAQTDTVQQPTSQPPNSSPPLDVSAAPPQQTGPSADPASRFAAASSDSSPSPASEPAPAVPPGLEKSSEATPDHTAAAPASKPAETAVPELPANFSGVDGRNSAAPIDSQTDSQAEQPADRVHKIIDGDSLPSLAERYLGSANRANEIFACNRDVLSDPELLPIGVRLRIPNGGSHPAIATAPPNGLTSDAAAPPAAVASSANPPPQPQIASEPTTTAAPLLDIGSPGLSPLPPMGERTNSTGRIYIVQTGDTLSDIAQKLYGDSQRTDALLQANRDQLHSEQDLRPGMMLETP